MPSTRLVALAHVPRHAVPPKSVPRQVLGAVTAGAAAATELEGLPVFGEQQTTWPPRWLPDWSLLATCC